MDSIDRAMRGSSQAPLRKGQRRLLMARLIVPAWNVMRVRGLAGEDLESWRREEQFKACHKEYLRAATQSDYPKIVAHFMRLLGRAEDARRWDLKAVGGNIAVARHKLREAIAAAAPTLGDAAAYAAAIARCKFKTADLDALTARQAWTLVFDIRRAAQKRRQTGKAALAPATRKTRAGGGSSFCRGLRIDIEDGGAL